MGLRPLSLGSSRQYLDDIACPRKSLEPRDRLVLLDWLLTYAVTLEYSENGVDSIGRSGHLILCS